MSAIASSSAVSAYQYQMDIFSLTATKKTTNTDDLLASLNGYGSGSGTGTGTGNVTDSVELSAASLSSYSAQWTAQQLFGAASDSINGQYKTLDQINTELGSTLYDFFNLAGGLFSAAGVDLDNSVTLQGDGIGHLVNVGEENEDTGAVNKTLQGNNVLTSRFFISAALASIDHAAETDPQFVKDYNNDPAGTMEKYEETLKEYLLGFKMNLSSGGVSYEFGDPILDNTKSPQSGTQETVA